MEQAVDYRGRFAPSPTGPLHQGSLIAAVASYLDARAAGGQWFVRIEDIDPPREVAGASDSILRSLDAHGLHWDGSPLFQSTRLEAYAESLDRLQALGQLFSCVCTRATLGPGGSCGQRCNPTQEQVQSRRVRLTPYTHFDDEILGEQTVAGLPRDVVLRRKDGLFAYALAVVVDDAWQDINHVMRGRDLLGQTPAQLELMALLTLNAPRYAHLPILYDPRGYKLSKQNGAPALNDRSALHNLRLALQQLGQRPVQDEIQTPQELLHIATAQWDRGPLKRAENAALVYEGPDKP